MHPQKRRRTRLPPFNELGLFEKPFPGTAENIFTDFSVMLLERDGRCPLQDLNSF